MCDGGGYDRRGVAPRGVDGEAVDPIPLEPVDEMVITTLVDNSYDGLMVDIGPAHRMAMGRTPAVEAALFEGRATVPGMLAEHGFSALVTVRRGDGRTRLMFDTGSRSTASRATSSAAASTSPTSRPWCSATATSTTSAGFAGLITPCAARGGLPLLVHPDCLGCRRRVAVPGRSRFGTCPRSSRAGVEGAGFEIIEGAAGRRCCSMAACSSPARSARTTGFETRLRRAPGACATALDARSADPR